MPLILFIRHAENDYISNSRMAGRLPGVHLNTRGRAHVQALAEMLSLRLADSPPTAIYSSPLERALETAEPIARVFNLPVIPLPGLIEIDVGEWVGKKISHLKRLKLWRRLIFTPSSVRFPGGESFVEAQNRICQAIDQLCQAHADQETIACVSHADPIRLAIAFYLGLPLDMFQRLKVSPASLSILRVSEDGNRLLGFNLVTPFTLPYADLVY